MTKTSRRSVLGLGLATGLGLTASACGLSDALNEGAEHVLLGGHQLAAGTPFDKGLNKFGELVAEKTSGRVRVDVHPNAALGTETEMFQGLITGTLDIGIFAPGSIAEFSAEMSILSMPFLVIDRDQRDGLLSGGIAERLAGLLTERTKTLPLTYFGGSFRQMFFTQPATTLDDIRGRLFRVQPSAVLTDSFSAAVGVQPSVVAYNELYNALQQGVVDGADNEPVFIDSQKFYEPAPHILQTNHEVTIRPLIISQRTIDKLGPELGALVMEAGAEAGEYQRRHEAEIDDSILGELAGRDGIVVTPVDTAPVLDSVQPVWQRYAEQWGIPDVLEQIIDLRPGS